MIKRLAVLSLTAVVLMVVLAPTWAAAQTPDQQNLRRGSDRPSFRSGPGNLVPKRAVNPQATFSFPSASSAIVGSVGFINTDEAGYFWSVSRGDSVTQTFAGPASINTYGLDVDVVTNVLSSVGVNWAVIINGQTVDNFTVNAGFVGTVSRSSSFPAINGPNYTVVLKVLNEIAGGAGSHTFRYAGNGFHQIELGAAAPKPTLTAITPPSGAPGQTLIVTLDGTNFVVGATSVQVSGSGVTAVPVNADGTMTTTQMRAQFTIAASAPLGNRNVTVTTANGTSNALTFTVKAPDVVAPPAR